MTAAAHTAQWKVCVCHFFFRSDPLSKLISKEFIVHFLAHLLVRKPAD